VRTRVGRRAAAQVTALVLIAASALVTSSAPASATPAACTFNALPDLVIDVVGNAVITVACTGLASGQSLSINEDSPLAAIVQPASSAPFESSSAPPLSATADALGDLTAAFTVPSTFTAADPGAMCPPTQAQVNAGLAHCSLVVRDAVTSAVVASARLLYTAQPTPQVTPTVNISNGATFVAGDIVTFAGSGFWGTPTSSTPSVLFASTVAAPLPATPVHISATSYVCATDCNGSAGALTSGGTITGSVVVPSGLLPGLTPVTLMQLNLTAFPGNGAFNSVAASNQASILGAPNATATPNNGGPGTPVQVTGTGWDPQGSAPVLAFLTPATVGGTVSSATALVDANGNLSGVITVTSADLQGVNPIAVTQGGLNAQASYTVTDVTSQCVGMACTTNQVLTQQIGQGDLSLMQQSANVALTVLVLNGAAQHSAGQINAIDVVDDRGSLVGWTVTGTLAGDFVNQSPIGSSANNLIPASNLAWSPSVGLVSAGSGTLAQIVAGASTALSKTIGATLCAAATGGGGGAYRCMATLDLTVPASVAAGTYTVVLNITIT
jgi:hypothetical protein